MSDLKIPDFPNADKVYRAYFWQSWQMEGDLFCIDGIEVTTSTIEEMKDKLEGNIPYGTKQIEFSTTQRTRYSLNRGQVKVVTITESFKDSGSIKQQISQL